jgi:hypothetical protein
MEIGRKNKLLAQYGRGLARKIYEGAVLEAIENPLEESVINLVGAGMQYPIEELKKGHSEKELKKIFGYMATEFINMGHPLYAYKVLEDINPKRAKLIKRYIGDFIRF